MAVLQRSETVVTQGMIQRDDTVIRAHKHAASAPLLKRGQTSQCLGLPLRFDAGPGFEHDMKQAHGLIEGLQAQYVLADKAYDADSLIQTIHDNNAKACIPPKTNRLEQRAYDKDLYKERNQLEPMFGKPIKTCMGFGKRAEIYLWLK